MTLWMQSSMFWIRLFKQQQDAYLRMLGQFAEKIPHETAADLAREAEAMKEIATPSETPKTPTVVEAEKPAPRVAELATA
ncbi:MAG: hypothetical protein EA339_08050 [Rhodobacteraceae bacterium]|nr:MAG: hypothetical protein EA339_08050 [Paracoccaceae bacterium]